MLVDEIFKMDLQNKNILDVGTGTGILAILSKKKQAGYVYAVDIDKKACENVYENIKQNKIKGIIVKQGDASIINPNKKFDVIYENVFKNTVIADFPVNSRFLNKGGILLVSGFYTHDIPDVKKAAETAGFEIVDFTEKDNWAMMKFVKK
jgi:ribosomal protein L11 methyltransferase